MTYIILGGSGFLGSSLATDLRQRGEMVIELSFRPARQAQFTTEFTRLLGQKPVAVINAGASQNGRDDPQALAELVESNVLMPATLASLILTHSPETFLITFGTSWQIGEKGEPSPFNAYAASKAAAEPFLDHFALSGLRAVTLHLYDTYGPGDKRKKVVNLIADALATRSELPMSSGGQCIDLVHMDDVVAAVHATLDLLRTVEGGVHRTFAVRSGVPVTVLEVLALLKKAAGIDAADFIKPGIYPYRARERFSLYAATPTPPGWKPKIALEDGLRQLLAERVKATPDSKA